jgi:hypothetical protein
VFHLNRVINQNTVGTTPLETHHVGQIVDKIGVKSGVIVNAIEGKHASAHGLRRTFGTRWARRVMPAVLQKLMRHANVQTTMQYYVDLNVDEVADSLWANHSATHAEKELSGNTFGNNGQNSQEAGESQIAVNPSVETASHPK